MLALAGTDVSEKALRTLWLDKMPDSVKCIVIVNEEHLDKIAAMADKIVEMAPRTIDIAAVQDSTGVDQLMAKIATLEGQIASLKLQRKFRKPSPHHYQRSRTVDAVGSPAADILGRKSRLFIKGRETGCQFLVDSGADISILPWLKTKGEYQASQYKLYAGNDTVNRASKYFNLLNSYPDLTKPNLVNRVVKQGVKHHILTTVQPVYSKERQLAPDKLKLVTQEFQFMLDNDIIRPSKS
ncbi:transposon Ty3-I Gag-Pol polyprotein [Trichonephila clavipes]|nr:transposon Ty3-I Gag-Pol polyprotein [Trichonephila clavipes]